MARGRQDGSWPMRLAGDLPESCDGDPAWYGVMRTKTERAPWCLDDHARKGDCFVRGCGDNRRAVHVASRHFAEMLQFLRSNPHTIHDCPIVAFAFLVYKSTYILII
jgi:hypothetical protein